MLKYVIVRKLVTTAWIKGETSTQRKSPVTVEGYEINSSKRNFSDPPVILIITQRLFNTLKA